MATNDMPPRPRGRPKATQAERTYLRYWVRRLEDYFGGGSTRLDRALLYSRKMDKYMSADLVGDGVFLRILTTRSLPSRPVMIATGEAIDLIGRANNDVPGSGYWRNPAFLDLLDLQRDLPQYVEAGNRADEVLQSLGWRRHSMMVKAMFANNVACRYSTSLELLVSSPDVNALAALAFLLVEAQRLGVATIAGETERALRKSLTKHLRDEKRVKGDYLLRREIRSLWDQFLDRVAALRSPTIPEGVEKRAGTPFVVPNEEYWVFEEFAEERSRALMEPAQKVMEEMSPTNLNLRSGRGWRRYVRTSPEGTGERTAKDHAEVGALQRRTSG